MKTPLQLLSDAKNELFTWVDYKNGIPTDMSLEYTDEDETLTLYSGLDVDAIHRLESQLPAPLQNDILELLTNFSGFCLSMDVSFTEYNTWEYSHLLPHVMVLAADGCGNNWVIEVNPSSGQWKHVWYGCHDPCELKYQCETLGEFIDGVLDLSRFEKCQAGYRSVLDRPRSQVEKRFPTAAKLRNSAIDETTRSFVNGLNDNDIVVDLRNPQVGDAFNVWAIASNQTIKRHGQELLFAYRPKQTIWQKLVSTLRR